ncbi:MULTISPECIES: helix-turn-helix domain-containing protein [Bacillus cereus group]|uniref:helix-turn-helix domain-containing protein n=1 Tax=Bacillus cereus group TaxID=86661 RepID=UPI00210403AA|nr:MULTISPECIES: helix-turn-helix transcriptional regulator [Bacillus cereus group]MDZ4627251.1 helix-turn-helix domain-containing protein [Bacillus cereus]
MENNVLFYTIQPENDIERIILLMKRFNLSQKEFACKIGISEGYLTSVLNKKNPLSKKLKRKIHEYVETVN